MKHSPVIPAAAKRRAGTRRAAKPLHARRFPDPGSASPPGMTRPELLPCHPGRSEAESRDPASDKTAPRLTLPGSRVDFAARDDKARNPPVSSRPQRSGEPGPSDGSMLRHRTGSPVGYAARDDTERDRKRSLMVRSRADARRLEPSVPAYSAARGRSRGTWTPSSSACSSTSRRWKRTSVERCPIETIVVAGSRSASIS